MSFLKKTVVVLSALIFVLSACKKDDENSNEADVKIGDKEGILLVTFGSSYPEPQKTFENIDLTAKAEFVGEEIRWGYTSDIILNKLRQGNGEGSLNGVIIDNDTPTEAIEVMIGEGYSQFAIQSLHVIPGEEFDELTEAMKPIEEKYSGVSINIGRPLLDTDEDLKEVAKVLAEKFSVQVTEGPVLFMGHGTPHEADAKYLKLDAELKKLNPNFFVGTVEGIGFDNGTTSIGGIIEKLTAITPAVEKVTITPLMSIAGDHANNDMNGVTGETDPAEQSWRERLEAEGYTVTDVMKGLGDYDEINTIWINHLKAVK